MDQCSGGGREKSANIPKSMWKLGLYTSWNNRLWEFQLKKGGEPWNNEGKNKNQKKNCAEGDKSNGAIGTEG